MWFIQKVRLALSKHNRKKKQLRTTKVSGEEKDQVSWTTVQRKIERENQNSVNPEYFVCIFLYVLYVAASVRK